ncbi:MAG TPA: hypothetical protein VGG33_02520, partial [Polyangia bacterium]
MARLTLMALVRTGGESLVQRYLDVTACRTLFFLPEACAFLTFIAESEAASPHAAAIASFERALIEAREAAAGGAGTKTTGDRQHTIIAFPAPAEVLLAALVSGEALPDVAARASYVEVSSDLPQLWRPIDVEPFDA